MAKTVKILVKGKVQGVFFRANVRKKALELGLTGYAKNLEDGDVEVVAQGNADAIRRLEKFIQSSPGTSTVEELQSRETDKEKFASFDIF